MKLEWKYMQINPCKLKTFFKNKGISRRLLAKIRYDNGLILINGNSGRKVNMVKYGDIVTLILPDEKFKQSVVASFVPIDILYEDDNYLIVNKPAFVASIPSPLHPNDTLVNRVLGYYQIRGYRGIIPHIVTRLDRDTSGIVIFAKHRYTHALLDKQLKQHQIKKVYVAILHGNMCSNHYIVDLPIARDKNSLIKRRVSIEDDGAKQSKTEIIVQEHLKEQTVCKVKLHTGRTHQIRVHCSYLNHSLVGDTLYGSYTNMPLQRQALHCEEIEFWDDFNEQYIRIVSKLPNDMRKYLERKEEENGRKESRK